MLTKFQGLATSGRHSSAMITDSRKLATKLTLHGMSSFHFLPLESVHSLSPGLYVPHKKGTYPYFRNVYRRSDMIWNNVNGQRGLITSSGHGQVI